LGPRRRIAATLKRLRDKSGKHLDEIAEELLISTSKLSRLENAQGKPQLRDIRDLSRYYGIEGTKQAASLERWVAAAQEPAWWTDYDDVLKGRLDTHLAYEADATVERVYTLPFLPVLLQTPEYARAIYQDMEGRSEDEIEQLLAVREKRKEALNGRDGGLPPLRLVAVAHESTLRQEVGSPRIMRDQLNALLKRPATANVCLRVLPFSSRVAFSMTCMYAYFEYQDADNLGQDVVHIETHAGFWSIDDHETVTKYRKAHEHLVEASLSEEESRAMIRAIRDSVRN
jgi:transcriptional regulator with XRE-family HTH domain